MSENFNMLDEVKKALMTTGNFQDSNLKIWIHEAQEYLLSAGVSESVVDTEKALGTIARGVADLRDYGKLGEYFKERTIQLACSKTNKSEIRKLTELTKALLEKIEGDANG